MKFTSSDAWKLHSLREQDLHILPDENSNADNLALITANDTVTGELCEKIDGYE